MKLKIPAASCRESPKCKEANYKRETKGVAYEKVSQEKTLLH